MQVCCSKCGREVSETVHTMGEYRVDFYGEYITEHHQTTLTKATCKECYESKV